MARRTGGEAVVRARIGAAPGLSAGDGHRLAGFLEGECHLGLVLNNGDDWRCDFKVSLRDDDRDTLIYAQHSLGLGQLYEKPAYCKSRPQVTWSLSSKLECAGLVAFLDAHAFRGRKLLEYEIWREAVAMWSRRRHGLPPGGAGRMAGFAASLKRRRAYGAPLVERPSLIDAHAPCYLAGFFSGEGSFGISARAARFVVKLRRDDRPLLDAMRRDFDMGSVRDVETPPPWSPAAIWHVTGARDVLRGIALFDEIGLLGRKRRQFEAWRPGAFAVARAIHERMPLDPALVASARRDLSRATAYKPPTGRLGLDAGYLDARNAYLDVLRAWARETVGPLSCTAYQAARERRRHWPTRNTLALTFGSWYEALRCAQLEHRAARRPSAVQLGVQVDLVHASEGR